MDRKIVFCLGTVNAGDMVGELEKYDPVTGDITINKPLAVIYGGKDVALLNEVMPHQYQIYMMGKSSVVIHRDRVLYFVLFDYDDNNQPIVLQYKTAIRDCIDPTAVVEILNEGNGEV